jgi:hypothetical protein
VLRNSIAAAIRVASYFPGSPVERGYDVQPRDGLISELVIG